MNAEPVFLTPAQLAERWQIGPGEVRKEFIRTNRIPHVRLSPDRIRIPLRAVIQFETTHTIRSRE